MKSLVRWMSFVVLLVLASPVLAADLTGTWKGSFDFQGSEVPMTLQLAVSGQALTGTILRPETPPATIHDAKLDGDTVSFWIDTDYQGTTYKLVFKGKVAAEQIDFIFGTEDGSWGTSALLKRVAGDAGKAAGTDMSGTWKGAFDFQGNSVPLVFHLKASAGLLSGTVEGLPGGASEVKEGVADGESLRFTVMTEYQGSPVKLIFKGKLVAAEIKFVFGTEDGSWGTELIAGKA